MNVILPQKMTRQIGIEGQQVTGKAPCLWLLHGYSDDHSTWSRRTSIERYVADRGIAVVMPAAHKSYYTNIPQGYQYWEYISEELPQIARSLFPLSEARQDNFVAGLSMGGFGAFKLALNHPDRYAAAASLSGAVHRDWLFKSDHNLSSRLFGSEASFNESINDLSHLVTELNHSTQEKPRLFQCCGSKDFLIEDNRKFRDLVVRPKSFFTKTEI